MDIKIIAASRAERTARVESFIRHARENYAVKIQTEVDSLAGSVTAHVADLKDCQPDVIVFNSCFDTLADFNKASEIAADYRAEVPNKTVIVIFLNSTEL